MKYISLIYVKWADFLIFKALYGVFIPLSLKCDNDVPLYKFIITLHFDNHKEKWAIILIQIAKMDQLMIKILCSIDQPDAEEIISVRTVSPFKNKRDLLKRINSIQGNDCVNFLKVSSKYFIR